jgi:hypothetical protein
LKGIGGRSEANVDTITSMILFVTLNMNISRSFFDASAIIETTSLTSGLSEPLLQSSYTGQSSVRI